MVKLENGWLQRPTAYVREHDVSVAGTFSQFVLQSRYFQDLLPIGLPLHLERALFSALSFFRFHRGARTSPQKFLVPLGLLFSADPGVQVAVN